MLHCGEELLEVQRCLTNQAERHLGGPNLKCSSWCVNVMMTPMAMLRGLQHDEMVWRACASPNFSFTAGCRLISNSHSPGIHCDPSCFPQPRAECSYQCCVRNERVQQFACILEPRHPPDIHGAQVFLIGGFRDETVRLALCAEGQRGNAGDAHQRSCQPPCTRHPQTLFLFPHIDNMKG